MEKPFGLFEDVPLPALLLGDARGNHAAREIFGEHLVDAAGSVSEMASVHSLKLDTVRGQREFDVQMGRVDEGAMAWLELRSLDENWELEELKKQDAFKTQFLNMAAHELNTPLTPIRLQHHLLSTETVGKLSPEQKKSHDVIARNLDRLASLISDILDVARLESKALKVVLQPMDFAKLVRESLASYEVPAEQVGVALSWDVPDDLVVAGSAQRIAQVVDNLIGNAIKFTPEGGNVHVKLSGTKDGATFSVTDTGSGLTANQMSKLFKPFSQAHHDDIHGGTGLGLYICKGILEAHGQTIQCESAGQGAGSTFWFQLTKSAELPVAAPAPKNALADRLRELI